MRGIRAKALRREAVFIAGEIPTSYTNRVVKQEKVLTYRMNPDGTLVMIEHQGKQVPEYFLWDKITASMKTCTRRVYKNLKSLYKKENKCKNH